MALSWVRRPDVLMVATSAPTYVATSAVLRHVSAFDLTPLRFLAGAALIGGYLLVRRRRLTLRGRDWWRVVLVALLGYGVYGTLVNTGQAVVQAGTTSLLLNMSPVFAFALGFLVLGERTGVRGVIGIIVAVSGVVIITVFGDSGITFEPESLLVLAAALALAGFLVLQQPLLSRIPPVELVFWGCLIGGVSTLPLAHWRLHATEWPASTWIALSVLICFGTALAYCFWNVSLARTSVAKGGALMFAIPVFSVLLGWLLLGQVPSAAVLAGGVLALAGVVILNGADVRVRAPR